MSNCFKHNTCAQLCAALLTRAVAVHGWLDGASALLKGNGWAGGITITDRSSHCWSPCHIHERLLKGQPSEGFSLCWCFTTAPAVPAYHVVPQLGL